MERAEKDVGGFYQYVCVRDSVCVCVCGLSQQRGIFPENDVGVRVMEQEGVLINQVNPFFRSFVASVEM